MSFSYFFQIWTEIFKTKKLDFWLALFMLCSELRWTQRVVLYLGFSRGLSGSVAGESFIQSSHVHQTIDSLIEAKLIIWSRQGLFETRMAAEEVAYLGFRGWEMQTGIIRQGKQTFNKRTALEDKPGQGGSWGGGEGVLISQKKPAS